jgi:hypothetical protein
MSLSALDFSGSDSHGWRRKTHLASPGSVEGFHPRMAFIAWQVAHKSKSSHLRHLIFRNSSVCFWLWRCGDSSSFMFLLWYFWFSLGISVFVNWHLDSGVPFFTWSLCPVHSFSRWFPGSSLLSAAHLTCLHLGRVDGDKSHVVPRFSKHSYSYFGQDQTLFL